MLLGLIILMSLINIYFVLSAVSIVIIISILYFYFFKILITYGEFTFEFQGEALKRLLQTFTMIKEIKIFKKRKIFY